MGYEVFAKLCKERGVKPGRVAKETGVATATLSSWKYGTYKPKSDKLQKIATYFDVPVSLFIDGEETKQLRDSFTPFIEKRLSERATENSNVDFATELAKMIQDRIDKKERLIPLYSFVSAGNGVLATGDVIGAIDLPVSFGDISEYFALIVKGDSMSPSVPDGSTIIVHRQEDAESGQIVVAITNGDEGFCKKLRKFENGIALESLNPNYEPKYFSNKEIKDLPVTIAGRVIEVRTRL